MNDISKDAGPFADRIQSLGILTLAQLSEKFSGMSRGDTLSCIEGGLRRGLNQFLDLGA